jgi:hypothetical protein
MTIQAGAYVTIARADIIAGLPEKPSRLYILYMATGKTFRIPDGRQNPTNPVIPKTLPVLKEVLIELTRVERAMIWVLSLISQMSSSWTWTSCSLATWRI